MPYQSPFPPLDIPECNVLSYLFPSQSVTTEPQFIDAGKPENSLSASEVLLWVKRVAVGLDNMGIAEKRAIMIMTPNHIYIPVIYLAAVGSKRYFTGVNPVFTKEEVEFQMRAVDPAIVLVHPTALPTATAAANSASIPQSRIYLFADTISAPTDGYRDWRTIVASAEAAADWKWDPLLGEASKTTIAVINFSSGTTGMPKGGCISHHNLVANAAQTIYTRFQGEEPSDRLPERWLNFLPFYHAYSQLWTMNVACKLRIPVYVMEKFQYESFLQHIEQFKITSLQAVPPVLVMLSKRPETSKYDVSSIRHVICGAAPLSQALQNEINTRFNIEVAQGWGMTEVTCVGILVPGMSGERTGSVGYLVPNSTAKLVDEDEKEVGEGEAGEIWFKGPQVMLGYWNNERSTRETMTKDGWLRTGDIAVVKDGRFTIVDRKKELIKVNGLQVAPAELEAVLLKVEDVADAAVVGIVLHGEEVPRAYVVLQPHAKGRITEQDIQDRVASRVAKHKRLNGGVKFVDEIPKLASGKIVRKMVKEWAKADADLVERTVQARL